MNDVQVTLVGTITSDIRFARHGEVPVAKFRIRAQPRRFDKATSTWHDGEPSYYTAVAWRHLAEHVASSLGVGDPVLAHGRLRISRWRFGDDPSMAAEVELVSVGHDLRWGTTVYRKSQPPPLMRRSAAREENTGSEVAGSEGARSEGVRSEGAGSERADSAVAEPASADGPGSVTSADVGAVLNAAAVPSGGPEAVAPGPDDATASAAPARQAPTTRGAAARRRALAVVCDPAVDSDPVSEDADRAAPEAAMPRAA